ncbi:hypothetical protein EUGRSUZ_G03087 [Eucalyptus grandis]|uniref:Uncharacterized protein n=2 Tax=Eucalyptus grandis TaxID=71139 RepID=A0ACC3K9A0_EUCGR|nr:hypothetical protein EUGRSUZ_G03087 [Eucalyptus grandis]
MKSTLTKKTLTALNVTHGTNSLICLHMVPFYILCMNKNPSFFRTEVGNTKQSLILQWSLPRSRSSKGFLELEVNIQ